MARRGYDFSYPAVKVSAIVLGAFATAGMDWAFTGLVGLCIGFAVLQGIKHKDREAAEE